MNIKKASRKLPQNKFINRELSWLLFNKRVLFEANNEKNPVLERLRFLSISASNLDEFYMVRIASLLDQKTANPNKLSPDGLNADGQMKSAYNLCLSIFKEQEKITNILLSNLEKEKIIFSSPWKLNSINKKKLKKIFLENILPLLTPISIDPVHPFPFIPNECTCLHMTLQLLKSKKQMSSVIILPKSVDRFVKFKIRSKTYILLIEDVIKFFYKNLFSDYRLIDFSSFRIIRDSDIDYDDDLEDVVAYFKEAFNKRKRGEVVRLELLKSISPNHFNFIKKNIPLNDAHIIYFKKILGIQSFSEIVDLDFSKLKFKKFNSRPVERLRQFNNNCFAAVRSKDFVVHHPYETFDVVVDFLNQAANDTKVVAIKQTIYRTTMDSPIIKALIKAAEKGKSVTAVVEIKARFDEEANLAFASQMEKSGVQIVYGFANLKTHSKASLIIRKEFGKLRSYAHVGTGNYHPINAKIYEDLSLFTANEKICRDIEKVFNYVTGYAKPDSLNYLILSPINLRSHLNNLIDREIKAAKKGKPASMWMKMNSLVDPQMIYKLYEASNAGVSIKLFIRGICCLIPGTPNLSENIVVRSIVGRYLEHARIFCFANESNIPSRNNIVYIGSADLMPRNLDRRVETLTPIINQTVHEQILSQIMVANYLDNQHSWVMNSDGSYAKISCNKKSRVFSAHDYFMMNPSLSGRGKIKGAKKPKKLLALLDNV